MTKAVGSARRDEILAAAADLFAEQGITASVHQIADASGILPSSLYHHFDSKESIVVELIARYQTDLDRVAEIALGHDTRSTPEERIIGLASDIANCALRHRAAVVLTYFDPPSRSGEELSHLAGVDPGVSARRALSVVLGAAEDEGFLDPCVDVPALTSYLWHEMAQTAFRRYQTDSSDERMPELKCHVVLHGLAAEPWQPTGATKALETANEAMADWTTRVDPDEDTRRAAVVVAARSEFARRGYAATTMRDVAAAAGVSPRSTYRLVGSKEELLAATVGEHASFVIDGWKRVVGAGRPTVETIDALSWLYVNALDRFFDELKIQLQTLSHTPDASTRSEWALPTQLRILSARLDEGTRSGELKPRSAGLRALTRSVFSLMQTPESTLRELGPAAAFTLTRATVLNGVIRRE